MKGKIHTLPFPKAASSRANEVLSVIHTDICGPMQVSSVGGARYFVTFIDDMSRMIYVRCLKRRDEMFNAFKEFKESVERETSKKKYNSYAVTMAGSS